MTMRLRPLTPTDLNEDQRDLYDSIAVGKRAAGRQHFSLTDENGALAGPFGIMLHEPGIGRALQSLGTSIRYETAMSDRLREVAILAVASATDSAFERYAHERVGAEAGLSRDEMDAIRENSFTSDHPVEAQGYALCRRILESGALRLDDSEYRCFEEALGEPLIIDLTVLVGYYVTLANLLAIFEVGAPRGS